MTGPDADREAYVPVRIAPDPARDARVAARRAEDAARAGRALDRLLAGVPAPTAMRDAYSEGWSDGYREGALQHNRAYGVVRVTDESAVHVPHVHPSGEYKVRSCSRVECHNMGGQCDYCGGAQCRVRTITPHFRTITPHYGVAGDVPGWPENGCPRTGCERFHSGVPHDHGVPDPAETWCFNPTHPHGEGGIRLDECLAARRGPAS